MNPLTTLRNIWWIIDIRRCWMVHIALIVLAGVAVYSNTFRVEFVLDDYANISFQGPKDILTILLHGGSRRVADATFAINYHLHGLQVPGYHLVNLAIHISVSIFIYFVVVSALTALRTSFSCIESAAKEKTFADYFVPVSVALLFAVHPVQTQAVTYIIQRYTSLATFFYLLSVLLFIRGRLAFERSGTYLRPLFLGGGCLVAGILAINSKQIAATLPLMLILLELFLFRGRLLTRKFYICCGVLGMVALTVALITWHDRSLQDFFVSLHRATSEDHYSSRTIYFYTQTRVVVTYLRLLCLPLGQSLFHGYYIYTTLFSLPVIASLTLHLSLIITAAVLFRLSRRQLLAGDQLQGILQRLASLGIVWFYLAMTVESSLFPITDVIFEHRIYLPSVGFFLTAVAVSALAANSGIVSFKAAWALLTVVCLVLGGLTIARNQVWSNTLMLWQDTVKKSPNKDLAVANLAGEYMRLNMPDKALPLFVRALELNQVQMIDTKVYLGKTLQWLNIDGSRFTTGEEITSSIEHTGRVGLDRKDEERLQSVMYNNLGLAYDYLGEPVRAKEAYRAALMINPAYDLAWYNLGLLAIKLGDREQADNALLQLNKIKPSLAESLAKSLTR